uniref:Uncharacterized protein n=1 Tax=Strigamia maritima TaxID=126957 RepID=T1JDA8_STRMM
MADLCILNDPLLEKAFKNHKKCVRTVDFSPTAKQLASGGDDSCVIVWNLQPNMQAFRFLGHEGPVTCVHFSPTGDLLASASRDRTVRLWVPKTKGQSVSFKPHVAPVRSVRFSNCGKLIATTSDDKSIKVWNVHDQKFVCALNQHTHWVRSARFSPDDKMMVSGSDDKTVRLWDFRTKECIHTFTHPTGVITDVIFHPVKTSVASSSGDVHNAAVKTIDFHPAGNFILTASEDRTLKILDLLEGRLAYTINAHTEPVHAVAFSRCGQWFASGGNDLQVLVWKTNLKPLKVSGTSSKCEVVSEIHHEEPGAHEMPSLQHLNLENKSSSNGIEAPKLYEKIATGSDVYVRKPDDYS